MTRVSTWNLPSEKIIRDVHKDFYIVVSITVLIIIKIRIINVQGLPWWSSGEDIGSGLPMQGAWVLSLDRELRSHMPCGVPRKGYYKYPKLRICFKNCGLFVRWHII